MAIPRAMPATESGSAGPDRKAVFLSDALLLIGFVALLVGSACERQWTIDDHIDAAIKYGRG